MSLFRILHRLASVSAAQSRGSDRARSEAPDPAGGGEGGGERLRGVTLPRVRG